MTWKTKVLYRKYYVPKHLASKKYLPISLPPPDDRCEVCRKHTSKLKPFGGREDPLVDELRGEILVMTWRPDGPYSKEAQKAWKEAKRAVGNVSESDDLLRWLTTRYGKRKGKRLYDLRRVRRRSWASWECRDCIVLSDDEYFEKLKQGYDEHANG